MKEKITLYKLYNEPKIYEKYNNLDDNNFVDLYIEFAQNLSNNPSVNTCLMLNQIKNLQNIQDPEIIEKLNIISEIDKALLNTKTQRIKEIIEQIQKNHEPLHGILSKNKIIKNLSYNLDNIYDKIQNLDTKNNMDIKCATLQMKELIKDQKNTINKEILATGLYEKYKLLINQTIGNPSINISDINTAMFENAKYQLYLIMPTTKPKEKNIIQKLASIAQQILENIKKTITDIINYIFPISEINSPNTQTPKKFLQNKSLAEQTPLPLPTNTPSNWFSPWHT